MIKSLINSDPFKVIFSIYTSCQKYTVSVNRGKSQLCLFSQSTFQYYLTSKNGNEMKFIDLNSLKSCRLLSAYERYRPVLNTSLLSRSIFQDHLFNTRFIVIFEIELKLIPLI